MKQSDRQFSIRKKTSTILPRQSVQPTQVSQHRQVTNSQLSQISRNQQLKERIGATQQVCVSKQQGNDDKQGTDEQQKRIQQLVQHAETLNSRIQGLEKQLSESQQVIQLVIQTLGQYDRELRKREEEINYYITKLTKQDDIIRRIKNKKKEYKQKVTVLSRQIGELQQNDSNPIAQLLEMRQLLLQMRMTTQIIPLIVQQQRLRQYQVGNVDVDNMSYEQLLQLEEQMGNLSQGISRQDIRRIPKRRIGQNDNITDLCTVCQCNLTVNDQYRRLGCTHIYHSKCIKGWLLHHNNCPVCKTAVAIPQ